MKRVLSLQFFIELIVVGLMFVLFGYIAGNIVAVMNNAQMAWNDSLAMQTLFLAGVLAHLVFEISGINQKYCINYLK